MAAKRTSKAKTSAKPRASQRTRRTPSARAREDWAAKFFEAFREYGTVKSACEAAAVGRSTVYERRDTDEAFRAAWDEVDAEVTEDMEREARRRAVEGWDKRILTTDDGDTILERAYSDTLLAFLLKARRPATYRENVRVEHGGSVTARHQLDLSKLTDEQLAALEAIQPDAGSADKR